MSYVYPLPKTATTGRVDQGQDFGGTGAILAVGNSRVLKTGAPGWPGGAGVLYQLLDGPRRGQSIFVYEGISPTVRPGQILKAGQVIGHLIPGSSTGIEMGFADSNGVPISHSEYTEGKETKGGKEMQAFLSSLKSGGSAALAGVKGTVDEAFELATGGVGGALVGLGGDAGKVVAGATEGAAGALADEVIAKLAEKLGINANAILLNVGLVGGGAFLIYYGAALMVGAKSPVAGPVRAGAQLLAEAPK